MSLPAASCLKLASYTSHEGHLYFRAHLATVTSCRQCVPCPGMLRPPRIGRSIGPTWGSLESCASTGRGQLPAPPGLVLQAPGSFAKIRSARHFVMAGKPAPTCQSEWLAACWSSVVRPVARAIAWFWLCSKVSTPLLRRVSVSGIPASRKQSVFVLACCNLAAFALVCWLALLCCLGVLHSPIAG